MFPRIVVVTLLLVGPVSAAPPKDPKAKPNRLAKESSPYLLQHAYNPVDWFPWGEEAFAKAKKEGKMIFLSVGYSSCHWCHVMERESFANPEVAKIMNENFVCIKLDREERPDVDQIYMTALNVLGQRGGWPLSMFLTPDAKPIFGGTYWPPEDKSIDGEKVLGFKSVMKAGLELWSEKRKELEAQGDKVAEATVTAMSRSRGFALAGLERSLIAESIAGLKESADPVYGGFGNREAKFRGTKFPTPPYLDLLAYEVNRAANPELSAILGRTLDHMASGGMYDQLGGGFHRYSTERTWTVPHFEKMLYDNAQLLECYADAFRRTQKPLYRQTMANTIAFLRREMTDPQGGFYSALDADSEEEEGRFYVWTPQELEAALPNADQRNLVKQVFGADEGLNFEGKYHILLRNRPLKEVAATLKLTEAELTAQLAPLMKKLFDIRAQRERPFLDTKVLTAWNGQMIAGLAKASQALEDPATLALAVKSAEFLLANLRGPDGRLFRTWSARPGDKPTAKLNAYLDDYAYLVHGLLNLHDATKDKRWLDQARALTDTMVQHHHDKERGGFFYTSHDHEKLFARAKDQYDGAQPSGNGVAARNLVRLWTKTGEARYRDLAEETLKAFVSNLKNNPTGATTMAQALGMFLDAREKK